MAATASTPLSAQSFENSTDSLNTLEEIPAYRTVPYFLFLPASFMYSVLNSAGNDADSPVVPNMNGETLHL